MFVYTEQADRRAKRPKKIKDALINCMRNDMNGFAIHYHPILSAESQRWQAVEALCRWTMPDGTSIPPIEFIRFAEQMNLIGQLDSWVRRTAIRQCVDLGLTAMEFTLNINFSPTQRIDDSFIDYLTGIMREASFPAHKLNLEITETAKVSFDEDNLRGLRRLTETGIILSIDDFGTGYSSFSLLLEISATMLKTEKHLLDGIEDDRHRQYLLNMLANLAHDHGMELIAEGIESYRQLDLLKRLNVDYVQGYLFSKPLSYDQLKAEVWRFQ